MTIDPRCALFDIKWVGDVSSSASGLVLCGALLHADAAVRHQTVMLDAQLQRTTPIADLA
jgi:hypothetical protein